MPDIRDVNIPNVDIGISGIAPITVAIPEISPSIPQSPVVTEAIGTPIMQIPGCVETRENNNKDLPTQDPRGNMVLCDGTMPSFKPIEYNPNDMTFSRPQVVPPKLQSEPDEQTKEDALDAARRAAQINTAVLNSSKNEDKTEENTTQPITRLKDAVEQLIPPAQPLLPPIEAVTTTASIALVATTSALLAKPLADFLLKLIKPTIKKIIAKLQKARGKEPPRESVRERILSQRDRNRAVSDLTKSLKQLKRGLK